MVNSCDFYSYRLIGKLTAFFAASGFQLARHGRGQFHFRRAAARLSLHSSKQKLAWLSLRLQLYELRLI
jgi:hypothetical protein